MNRAYILRFLYHLTIVSAGFTTLALEIITSRALAPHFGMSLDVWGAVLVMSLVALALGYYWGERTVCTKAQENLPSSFVRRSFFAVILVCVGIISFYPLVAHLINLPVAIGGFFGAAIIVFPFFFLTASLTPILVRIEEITAESEKNTKTKSHGRTGQILAESTLGSVAGALVCVYLLIPHMALEAVLVYVIAPLFISASFVLAAHRRFMPKSARVLQIFSILVTGVLLSTGSAAQAKQINIGGLLAEQKEVLRTGYGTIRILKTRPPRSAMDLFYWLIDGRTQDIVASNGQHGAEYTNATVNMLIQYPKKIKTALILGGGPSVIARDLFLSGIQTDVVDILKESEALSKKYFSMVSGVKFITQDARVYLNRCPKKYDTIVFDVFGGYGVPEHMITKEAFLSAKKCLNPNGIISANVLRDPNNETPDTVMKATLSAVFPYVDLYTTQKPKTPIVSGIWVASDSIIEPLKFYGGSEPELITKELKDNWGYKRTALSTEISTDNYPAYSFSMRDTFKKEHDYTVSVYGLDVMMP